MKYSLLTVIITFIFGVSYSQGNQTYFKQLQTLQGTWSMQTKRGVIYESWTKINDSTMTGKSYKIINADTMLLEAVQLVIQGANIFYIPTVQNENSQPVYFKLSKVENETFTFDNPGHDFPQLIVYQLPKNEVLHAWIEGLDKGSYRKSDYYYKKVK